MFPLHFTVKCFVSLLANCTVGEYYDSVVKVCLKCNFGTYQSEPYQETCELCPPGTTTQQQASTTQAQCIGKSLFCL